MLEVYELQLPDYLLIQLHFYGKSQNDWLRKKMGDMGLNFYEPSK